MLAEDPVVVMETKAEGESASADAQSFKDAAAQLNFPPKTVDRVIQARQKMLLDPPVKPAEDAEVGEKIAYLTQLITASDWQGVASFISGEADCESCFDQMIGHLAARDESVTPGDVLMLLSLRTQIPDKDTLNHLGQLLKKSQARGNVSHLIKKL